MSGVWWRGWDVDGASISVSTAGAVRETLWASNATAELLEELHFNLGEGVGFQAARTGRPVVVLDLRHSREVARWPVFAAAVAEHSGVRALFALPLQWGITNLGVLDLYRLAPGGLSPPQWRDALPAADVAALLMLGLRTDPDHTGECGVGESGTDPVTGRRGRVYQAAGMVLIQLDVSAPVALARLRGYAFAHQRLLIDVAGDVVNRRLVFTDDMD